MSRGKVDVLGRALILATLVSVIPLAAALQEPRVLHIAVTLVDAERKTTPVPRHALLISDNPATRRPGGSSRRWMAPPT